MKMMSKRYIGIALLILFASAFAVYPMGQWASQYRREPSRFYRRKAIIVKLGYFMPDGQSDLWEYNSELLTVSPQDFNGLSLEAEFSAMTGNYLEFALGFGYYDSVHYSEYRDYLDSEGYPIEQQLSLRITPITFTFKGLPLGRKINSTIVPYVGGGFGVYLWRYDEIGDYIDFTDFTIWPTAFESSGADLGFHLVAGAEIPIGSQLGAVVEVKKTYIKGKLSGDFVGFERFDLGGLMLNFGVSYRF
jgi:hypothetical protein